MTTTAGAPTATAPVAPVLPARRSPLWLDPRTKLALLFAVNVGVLGAWLPADALWARIGLTAIPLALLALSGGWRLAVGAVAALAVCQAAAMALVGQGPALTAVGSFAQMALRMLPVMITGVYVVTSTHVSELIAAAERWHTPRFIVIPLAVVLRFAPTVIVENRQIAEAMRMRAVGSPLNLVAWLEFRLVPLLACLTRIGDELTAAALTRGLGGPHRRTSVYRVGFGAWDALVVLAVAAIFVVALW